MKHNEGKLLENAINAPIFCCADFGICLVVNDFLSVIVQLEVVII